MSVCAHIEDFKPSKNSECMCVMRLLPHVCFFDENASHKQTNITQLKIKMPLGQVTTLGQHEI